MSCRLHKHFLLTQKYLAALAFSSIEETDLLFAFTRTIIFLIVMQEIKNVPNYINIE